MTTRKKTWREQNPEAFNAAWRRWYRANAAKKIAWQARRRVEMRAWLVELKRGRTCQRCGESAPECLHFHHRDPSTKEREVSAAIEQGWSKRRILAEIAKCDVLCANCHCKEHWREQVEW